MSIANLFFSDVNSEDISFNITGAITGSTVVNFKRLNNIVYISFNAIPGTATANSFIILTPVSAIPNMYLPPLSSIDFYGPIANNGNTTLGLISMNSGIISISIVGGGNFTGISGLLDFTSMYKVLNF